MNMEKKAYTIRIFVNVNLKIEYDFLINNYQVHYIKNVMRASVGDSLIIFNGKDGEYEGQIIEFKKQQVKIKILSKIREQTIEPKLVLVFCPIKKERLHFIIEKCTELGVSEFQPIISERTQINKINIEKIKICSQEASEQTERLSVPIINPLMELKDFLNDWPKSKTIIFCDEMGGMPIIKAMKNINRPIYIMIGPEGGFSSQERKLLLKYKSVKKVSLGPRILRSDTAAISAVTCYQSISGDW